MLKYILVVLFSPMILFGDINEDFSKFFVQNLSAQDTQECHRILDEWEIYEPQMFSTIQGLRATVVLLEGNITQSTYLLEKALCSVEETFISEETAKIIRDLYKQAWDFEVYDKEFVSSFEALSPTVMLCKVDQPKGVKVKYWFGIAQIVAACFVAPFSPPAAGALALSGINTTIQAAGDAVDNKEQWERNLNERQRMAPNNAPSVQNNSYNATPCWKRIIIATNTESIRSKRVA